MALWRPDQRLDPFHTQADAVVFDRRDADCGIPLMLAGLSWLGSWDSRRIRIDYLTETSMWHFATVSSFIPTSSDHRVSGDFCLVVEFDLNTQSATQCLDGALQCLQCHGNIVWIEETIQG